MGLVLYDIIKHMAVFCMPFISSNLINNVKTRRELNFRKEKHEIDHNYHGVNGDRNTTTLK